MKNLDGLGLDDIDGVDCLNVHEGISMLAPSDMKVKMVPEKNASCPEKKVSFKLTHDQSVKHQPERMTLDTWKLYLDSCATYHSAFVDWMLDNVREVNAVLKGNCNAGVTTSSVKGYYGLFDMWLNKKGIANLLSIPQLERDGYEVDYNTKRDWVVIAPTGKRIVFKRDTGLCDRMPRGCGHVEHCEKEF